MVRLGLVGGTVLLVATGFALGGTAGQRLAASTGAVQGVATRAGAPDAGGRHSRRVALARVPNGGIQPQAATDSSGTLHLIYFRGSDAAAGDLFYVRRAAGSERFSEPIRVNSRTGTVCAAGSVRGGQIALGRGGRVHVVWNGAGIDYARMNDAGTAFEDQRNLMRRTTHADGGGTVAADDQGGVHVLWHANLKGQEGEADRAAWVARSADDGRTFSLETPAWDRQTGACACCSMRALADHGKTVYVLYRSATAQVNRDVYLLLSDGAGFRGVLLHRWKVHACPMSTMALVPGPRGIVAAWDTDGQIYFTTVRPGTADFDPPRAAPGAASQRKHPAVAFNAQGEMLLAWTEGTGWQRGGALAWQVYDRAGNPTEERGRLEGAIPVWGLPAAAATPQGFTIIH